MSSEFLYHAKQLWETERPRDDAATLDLAHRLEARCGPTTNLYIFDLRSEDPLKYQMQTLAENVSL
jgi:hypothetical protein